MDNIEPIPWVFFCSEADYPKFFALFGTARPDDFPPTYEPFVALVDERIKKAEEDITLVKAYVRYDEFTSYCAAHKEGLSYDALMRCTHLAHGHATGGKTSG